MTVLTRTMTLLLLLLSMQSFAVPKHFKVTLIVPPGTDEKKLWISYDDGTIKHPLKLKLVHDQLEISGEYQAHYVTIRVYYNGPGQEVTVGNCYWVAEKPATIRVTGDWKHPALVNAQAVSEAGHDAYDAVKAAPENDKNAYWEAHSEAIMKLGSAERQVFFGKMKTLDSVKLAFLRQQKNTYYGLWLLQQEILWMGHIIPYGYTGVTPAQIRTLLDEVVPKKKEYAFERACILTTLVNREVGVGVKAPAFSERDIHGNKICLADYRGKYVLLNFWGSWCPPCVAELPAIKKIYDTYNKDQLAVIGVARESDTTAFLKAVDKHEVQWTKLYNKSAMSERYGVAAWPTLFLIDPSGKIVYSRDQELPETEDSLPLLQNILRKRLTR
ncbi:peroxiredoxin family protein [Chitinophaga qingshengii]|uniref:TlpA family protein disulfide reductase n=1 Tax=Chitinophaga qingshengii TaxID=1569794 RepID=A0ABR7TNY9_9BACT|nr:TlpA disulfide reductase family protein [Chitinophaga qingshengii]MBC9932195.1 TlpA family protein disulfide reductase [Chitinophaga qingshengii]